MTIELKCLHCRYSSRKRWNRFLLLPADCRGAESDSGRSPPPAQKHVIGGSRTTGLTLLTSSLELQWANLEERPFTVCSPQLTSGAPQCAVHPCQLAVWAQRGRAHAERAQIIRCSNKKSRQAQANVTVTKPTSAESKIGECACFCGSRSEGDSCMLLPWLL